MFEKWFDIWYGDKESIIATMVQNMADDLNAGYDYFGKSIMEQRKMIEEYKAQFDAEYEMLKGIVLQYADGEKRVERWCYLDLKKRGAIA